MAGLPGTGKSTLAGEILRVLPGVRLDKDRVRPALFPEAEIDYSRRQDDVCMEAMLLAAAYLFEKDLQRLIVLDGRTFTRQRERGRVLEWAGAIGVAWLMIECVCPDEMARERLERDASVHPARNRNYALYLSAKAGAEPIREAHLVIDTSLPLDECTQSCLKAIRGADGPNTG